VHDDLRLDRRRDHPAALLNYAAWAILFGAELNAQLDRQADIDAAGGPHAGLTRPARRG
jgi:hypothetical protein